jgi:hypothetical protein
MHFRALLRLSILFSVAFASPAPDPTPAPDAELVERQTHPTLYGNCHTVYPPGNTVRGVCSVTSPTGTPYTALTCGNGGITPRPLNCTSEGSVSLTHVFRDLAQVVPEVREQADFGFV